MNLNIQKKIGWGLIVFLTILLLGFILWRVFLQVVPDISIDNLSGADIEVDSLAMETTDNLNAIKYQSAIKKIEELKLSYQKNVFDLPLFSFLKSYLPLPLKTGIVGKDNPFLLPLPPDQILMQKIQ